ncbi:MAG TPA: serine hydrolase domain-containing protein, partial [Longimicrobium sp.]|nr:serine hydrolase domain-containing protein [Longimicrobium sp.]
MIFRVPFAGRLSRIALLPLALAACASSVSPGPSGQASAGGRSVPDPALVARLQAMLDSVHAAGSFPGGVAGFALADGSSFALAVGQSDTVRDRAMHADDRLLLGSAGKTYFAALALQLVSEGRLGLDEPIARYLGREPWFDRLPNARNITVRMLMNHTSGLVRYELNPRFLADLTASPGKTWTGEERLTYLFDAQPPFAAGQGWDYSDTNYIVLGMILERITGTPAYDEIRRRFLAPLRLEQTVPSDRSRINGLAQGYAGPENPFGGADAMLVGDSMVINPQFEWAGGGWAASAADLARWARAWYEGRAFDRALVEQAVQGVAAPQLGTDVRYGLGVIVRPTPLGTSWGHSGFMPGYRTEMRYWPGHGVAITRLTNTTAPRTPGHAPGAFVNELATT